MTDNPLHDAWAWSQVEAAADDSLEGDSRARMAAAIARDARLRGAVERARAVHRALRAPAGEAVPPGLLFRLLASPGARSGRRGTHGAWPAFSWAGMTGTAAALGIAAIAVVTTHGVATAPSAAQLAAVQDFAVAMHYLQKTAALTTREVNDAIGTGVKLAVGAEPSGPRTPSTEPGG